VTAFPRQLRKRDPQPSRDVTSGELRRLEIGTKQVRKFRCGKASILADSGFDMAASGILVAELSRIISQSTGPAFLLGAMVGLVSLLIARLNRIVDRCNALTAIEDEDPAKGRLKTEIPRLKRRAQLVTKAIEFAVVSGVFTTCLVIVSFASAFLGVNHVYGAAVLFMLALSLFVVSLIYLGAEVRMAVSDFDYYA
jgi:hypothetical protein